MTSFPKPTVFHTTDPSPSQGKSIHPPAQFQRALASLGAADPPIATRGQDSSVASPEDPAAPETGQVSSLAGMDPDAL